MTSTLTAAVVRAAVRQLLLLDPDSAEHEHGDRG
jgi:hypothetical protein